MRAVRFVGVGRPPEIADVPKPEPRSGEVLVKIAAAGVCHSDLHVMQEDLGFHGEFTLGHENAGWIEQLGAGVTGFREGDTVAVYGAWGCGHCYACQMSAENYCENWAAIGAFGGGLGLDGGMAEYMLVPSARFLAPIGSLSPTEAAPLTDAALTPYHAIERALSLLTGGATAVVIGIGGLGHMAIQLLRAVAPVRVVAADIDPVKLSQAKTLGVEETVDSGDPDAAAEQIRRIVGPRGAALVLDCVGVQPTFDLGARIVGRNSAWTIVGLGGGRHVFQHGSVPYGCTLSIPYWGTRVELMKVIAMASDGLIHAEITEFPLEQAVEVYSRLQAGQITGRAVLVPERR